MGEPLQRPRKSNTTRTRYLVLWWYLQTPYVGLYDDEVEAALIAQPRNGVLIEIDGEFEIKDVVDYWRRDSQGNPMPVTWKTSHGDMVI